MTLRLGYFPNVTHAQPQVGLARGTFAEALGRNVTLETKTFNAGPAVIEALFAGEIDASYIGPNPAINGYVQSDGKDAAHHRRRDERRRAARRAAGSRHHDAPPTSRTRRSRRRSSATRRTSRCAPGSQTNGLNAQEQGGNVTGPADRERRHADALPEGRARRRLGAGALGDAPRSRRPAARSSSTRRRSGRRASSSRRTSSSARSSSRSTRTSSRTCMRAHVETTQWINENPDEAKTLVNAEHREDHEQGAAAGRDRCRLGEPRDHLRPDRLEPDQVGGRRLRARLPRRRSPTSPASTRSTSSTRCSARRTCRR